MPRLACARRHLWIGAAVIAFAFLGLDGTARMRGIRAVSDLAVASSSWSPPRHGAPEVGRRHVTVVPSLGTDGYQWVLQTEYGLAAGEPRVHWVDYDGPSGGRATNWNSLLRWWLTAMAWVEHVAHRVALPQAVERAFPWANTALMALLLLALTPPIRRRFGRAPAALFALLFVTAYPFYEQFAVGYFDHHALASGLTLVTVLFALAGGAGWVRRDPSPPDRDDAPSHALREWLPSLRHARRWMIASGLAGGAGLWISASTQVPALVGIASGALVATLAFARPDAANAVGRIEPGLWRTWGIAGALASCAFFLLEYAPSNIALRLEVNHPLYALAWLAGGDLLARLATRRTADVPPPRGDRFAMALDAAAIALVPFLAITYPAAWVIRPGTLVAAIHAVNIIEFQSVFARWHDWTWAERAAGLSMLPPLVLLPSVWVVAARVFSPPLRALVVLSLAPALIVTGLGIWQTRWLGNACGLWLPTLVALLTALRLGGPMPGASRVRRALLGAVIVLAVLPFPTYAAVIWSKIGLLQPARPSDVKQLVTRDVAHMLRARLGATRGFVASTPTTSTWLTYFGGMRSLGTLYWDNATGLAATAEILGAVPPYDVARTAVRTQGITHLVLFSWDDPLIFERAEALRTGPTARGPDQTLVRALLAGRDLPSWLRPIPYALPALPTLQNAWVAVFEVLPAEGHP
jgi:hypothetical protein